MIHNVEAIYDQGVFRPLEPLVLPDGARVHLRIEDENGERQSPLFSGRIHSPRLAHSEQAAEFTLEIREEPDASV
jgi:predicted DNA-binding antitoxin AbrB/MazE fold protein